MESIHRSEKSHRRWARENKKKDVGIRSMERVAAGDYLPTPFLFEPPKRPDDRADYYIGCNFPRVRAPGTRFNNSVDWGAPYERMLRSRPNEHPNEHP